MVIVIIKMSALPEKRLELKQTLQALTESTRRETGCLSHSVFQDIENDNRFSLVQTWENQAVLDNHLRSDEFTVLMGARSRLSQSAEIMMNEVSCSLGWEAVEAIRS